MSGPEPPSSVVVADNRARTIVRVPAPMILHGVTYGHYVQYRDEPSNGHLRMTYCDGTLEIMSPESTHEIPSRRLGLLVAIVAEELGIVGQGTGSTTFRKGRRDLKKGRGKEPDESFYFANAVGIMGRDSIDLDRDPPPDLWIEVDNRSSSRGRLPLYAALGVPEVWRYRVSKGRLWFGRLGEGGAYDPIDRSISLPQLTPALVLEGLGLGVFETIWMSRLRNWARESLPRGQ